MVIAEVTPPTWLQAMGQAAGTILLLELMVALLVVLALVAVLAVSAWYSYTHVVPLMKEVVPPAQRAMALAQKSSDKVVQGVAEFYGRRQQVETGLRVLLFGREAADRYHEDALAQANADLQAMTPIEHAPGPENGYTPRLDERHHQATSGIGSEERAQLPAAIDRDGHSAGGRVIAAPTPASGTQPRAGAAIVRPQNTSRSAREGDYPNLDSLAGNAS